MLCVAAPEWRGTWRKGDHAARHITPEFAHGARLLSVGGKASSHAACSVSIGTKALWKHGQCISSSSRAVHARKKKNAAMRKCLLPQSGMSFSYYSAQFACTDPLLPNCSCSTARGWTVRWGQALGCPDTAGKLMEAADGCNRV